MENRNQRWVRLHPVEAKENGRRYRRSPKGQSKTLLTRYGITLEQRDAQSQTQGHACAACKQPWGAEVAPCIDHDHSCCINRPCCGECFRGLLCFRCNAVLGSVQDNPDLLLALRDYILQWRNRGV
jgi:Recombination endonuclease VII